MIVTLTSLRLNKLWKYFKLTYFGMQITLQARKQNGFIRMKNTGFGYDHFTMSAWNSENEMKEFARSGAHLEAMKQSRSIASEVRIYTYETSELPDWNTAKELLKKSSRIISYES